MRRFTFSVGFLSAALALFHVVPAFASQVSLANFNNRLYEAHRGGVDNGVSSKIYVRWSPDGVTWSAWEPQANVQSNQSAAPVLAAFGTKLFLAFTGTDQKIYTRSLDQGTPSSNWGAADVQTADTVAMATFNGKLYQSFRGLNNQIYIRSFDGQNWSGWSAVSNLTTLDAPALVAFRDKLYLSFRGQDQQIYTAASDGTNWNVVASAQGPTPSAPSLTTLGNKLLLTQRGDDQKLYTKTFDGQSWSNWTQVHNGDAQTKDAPAIAGFKGRLYYTIAGLNTGIYTASTLDLNWNGWQGWTEKGGLTPPKGSTVVDNSWTPSVPDSPATPASALTTTAENMAALLGGSKAGQVIGDGECVTLTNWATGSTRRVQTWQRGANVMLDGTIPVGTAIATFKGVNSSYDSVNWSDHTGIFAGYDVQGNVPGFWIWNQNFGPDLRTRRIFFPVGSFGRNMDANLYYVIQ